MISQTKWRLLIILLCAGLSALAVEVPVKVLAAAAVPTKVLFVGEDLSVVTSASKHPESPENAPAVVSLIDHNRIDKYGLRTLGEALSMVPGFYIADREAGGQPFFRGIPDSFLFLYNSVPMTSDSTKSIFPLGEELTLDFVKRIEIIKGPTSVLWGPDAFAGVVNIVPMEGRDIDGIALKVRAGTPDHEGHFTVSLGKNFGLWEGFVAVSATSRRAYDDSYNVLKCKDEGACTAPYVRGSGNLDDSKYMETVFNLSWKQWLKLSGRWSTMTNRYVVGEMGSDKKWAAKKKLPFRFIRLEAARDFGLYNFHFSSYYSKIPFEEQLVDVSWHSNSHVYYSELFIDRQLWDSTGLLTIGTSYRYNRITGAVLSKSFLPDFLQPGNPLFTPIIAQKDFNTSLFSVYGQVRKHWKWFDLWAGMRFDNHNQYDNSVSYNIGAGWHPFSPLRIKLLFGTAYRTPYNTQLVNRKGMDPEKIQNSSLNVDWKPIKTLHITTTGFWNEIKHHVNEDPNGGLSRPNSQDVYGIEATVNWRPAFWLNLWFNTTLLNNYGDKEKYKVLDYIIIEPDGSLKPFYSNWQTPFETGPKNLFNVGAELDLTSKLKLSGKLNYASAYTGYYDKGTERFSSTNLWITDLTGTYKDAFLRHIDAEVAVKNLFNERYTVPGIYSKKKSRPFTIYFSLKYRF